MPLAALDQFSRIKTTWPATFDHFYASTVDSAS
ncbi:MAG: hypothetical protein ACJARE_002064 [Paracoccaceae bacterium]|jgi:hypothetical protein